MAGGARTPRPRLGGPEPLVEAALEVIARDGVGAATVRSIAAQAGVSPGTVTHHFGSIDELLLAALAHGSGQVVGELERLALDLQDAEWDLDGWAARLAAVLAASIETHPHRHIACFELRLLAVRRPEFRPAADAVLAAYLRLARLVLASVDVPDRATSAARLVALTIGVVLGELGMPAEGRADRLRTLLAGELRATSGAARATRGRAREAGAARR